MPLCIVIGCKNSRPKTRDKRCRIHPFSRNLYWCRQWILTCNRNDILNQCILVIYRHFGVCSLHFKNEAYSNPQKTKLLYNAMPTEFASSLSTYPINIHDEMQLQIAAVLQSKKYTFTHCPNNRSQLLSSGLGHTLDFSKELKISLTKFEDKQVLINPIKQEIVKTKLIKEEIVESKLIKQEIVESTLIKREINNFDQNSKLSKYPSLKNENIVASIKIEQNITDVYDFKSFTEDFICKTPYLCDISPDPFSGTLYLRTHRKNHTKDKLFICDVCNRSFFQASKLYHHMKVHKFMKKYHTKKKPFPCDTCKISFTKKSILCIHKLGCKKKEPYNYNILKYGISFTPFIKFPKRSHFDEKRQETSKHTPVIENSIVSNSDNQTKKGTANLKSDLQMRKTTSGRSIRIPARYQ